MLCRASSAASDVTKSRQGKVNVDRSSSAGKGATAKQTRKPATKATKGRAPPAAARALSGDEDGDDDDDDDELMMSDRGEGGDDHDDAAAAADETTEVAETQFDSGKGNAKKGKVPATSNRRTAAAVAAAAAAAQAGAQKKTGSAEDAIADELSGSTLGLGKISAREKKLEAQLVLVSPPFPAAGP